MQLQTTSPESKFPNEYIDVIFIQIDQHLKKLFKKYKGFPIFWNTVYIAKHHKYDLLNFYDMQNNADSITDKQREVG